MARPEDRLEIPELGIRIEIRRRARETGGELVEFDVLGRPRGMIARKHVHVGHGEHIEVLAGALRLRTARGERVLERGDRVEIPAGAVHAQQAASGEPHHLRVQWRPAGPTEAFGERLAAMSREGRLNRWGYPDLLTTARFVREFGTEEQLPWPPARVNQAAAGLVLRTAGVIERALARTRAAAGRR
jgi:quercetin dioxygenase-like cupin family protein